MIVFIAALALGFIFFGCTSPEVKRVRGGGAGADVGNRGDRVEMHEGAKPYYKTPRLIASRPEPSETDQRQASRR
jgi:hypothetical protein